jgi:hypothetical protein
MVVRGVARCVRIAVVIVALVALVLIVWVVFAHSGGILADIDAAGVSSGLRAEDAAVG